MSLHIFRLVQQFVGSGQGEWGGAADELYVSHYYYFLKELTLIFFKQVAVFKMKEYEI